MNIFRASAVQMRKKVKRIAQKAALADRNLCRLFFKEPFMNVLIFPGTLGSPEADDYQICLKLAA
jgi:hypothetical protein